MVSLFPNLRLQSKILTMDLPYFMVDLRRYNYFLCKKKIMAL